MAYHVQPASFIRFGTHTTSCAHCSESRAGKDKPSNGALGYPVKVDRSDVHIELLLWHMYHRLMVHADVFTLVCCEMIKLWLLVNFKVYWRLKCIFLINYILQHI